MVREALAPRLMVLAQRLGWPLGAFVVSLGIGVQPIVTSGFRKMPGDPGDNRFVAFLLEHSFQWIIGGDGRHASLWDPPMFYPAKNTLAYSELMLSSGPLYWVWRILGLAPDTSFQLWFLLAMGASFFGAWLWLRRGLSLSQPAAAAGAFLFAAGAPRNIQLNHAHLYSQFFTIFSVAAWTFAFRTSSSRKRKLAIAAGIGCLSLQFYSSVYLFWFAAYLSLWVFLFALAFRPLRASMLKLAREEAVVLAGSAIGGAALCLPAASHYLASAREVGARQFGNVYLMLPRLESWLLMGKGSWLFGWQVKHSPWAELPLQHEHALFLGPLTAVLVGISWLKPGTSATGKALPRVLALACLAVVLTTTLFPGDFTLWRWAFEWLPGANAIRALSRIGIALLIPASLGVALTVESWRAPRFWLALCLIGLVLEQGRAQSFYDKEQIRADEARISTEIRSRNCKISYFAAKVPEKIPEHPLLREEENWPHPIFWKYQLDGVWAAEATDVLSVNGYSGNFPPGWWPLLDSRVTSPAEGHRLRTNFEHWLLSRLGSTDGACYIQQRVID